MFRRTKQFILGAVAASALTLVATAATAELTVEQIVQKTNLTSYYAGDDGRANVKMSITDSQGRSRTRQFTVLRKDVEDGGEQLFYIHFHAPADVAKMSFLVEKHLGRDDDRWLYLPALDLEKRISSADKRTSFAGSDFFYEDVSGRSLDLDTHSLQQTTDKFYVLEHKPKDAGSVEFSRYEMFVDKTTFLPMKVVFYDKNGKEHRIMTVLDVGEVQGHPTVKRAQFENKETGSKTVVAYGNVAYDLGLPDSVFGQRSLRRAPVKYMK